jgi:prepilin-type N-terminal cleavage/methylation domain-containing protein
MELKMKSQSGFTLVEIAIVLVIIGLLLGGVLKGQELINSAKVKNLANDFRQVPLFIYGYQDKYKRLPGDDANANTRFTGGVVATAGGTVGNGVIEGSYNPQAVTHETALFWQHVRLANLAAGSTDATSLASLSLPTNAEGGPFGIQGAAPINGMTGTYFACSEAIPFSFAQQLDTTMDDGVATTGTMRAVVTGTDTFPRAGTAPNAAAYATGSSYTVCLAF